MKSFDVPIELFMQRFDTSLKKQTRKAEGQILGKGTECKNYYAYHLRIRADDREV